MLHFLGDVTMNRFSLTKPLLVALVAVGGLSALGTSEAEAGWYGRSYSSSYSHCNSTIYSPVSAYCSPSYSYAPVRYDCSYSSWQAPTYYSPVTIRSPYSYDCGGYGNSGYNCYRGTGYGYGGCGFAVPISYGQCGW
jgi:hypothetical protein